MINTKIRIAKVNGQAVYKRKRKKEFIFVQASGLTDLEAKNKLIVELQKELSNVKEYTLAPAYCIFDAEKNSMGMIMQPLMPHCLPKNHNYIEFPISDLIDCIPA